MFENIRGDFRAHGSAWGAQGFWVLVVYRFGRWRYGLRPVLLRKLFSAMYHVSYKAVQVLTGIDLPCEARIGRNFIIDHFGGIVISGYARFGDNCRIRNGVVVGLCRVAEPGAPFIGNDVDIGAGAKLLGHITIGDNVLIGANAVVLCDVPSNCLAVGVPAVVKLRKAPGSPSLAKERPATGRTATTERRSRVQAYAGPVTGQVAAGQRREERNQRSSER